MWCKCFQSRLYELQNRERISLAAASKLLSNMAMLMPLSNTLIVVMIFRAWVSPWCDDRWVWQEGTRALLCWQVLILFNSIICFISKDSVFDLLLPRSDWERTSGNCYSALAPDSSLPMVSLMLDTGDDNVAHDGDLDAETYRWYSRK